MPSESASAGVIVVRSGDASAAAGWRQRVEQGVFLVLEGDSSIAAAFGFELTEKRVPVRNVVDSQDPELEIIWEEQLEVPVFAIPAEAKVFTRERWSDAPLAAGMQLGKGAVLWLAASPGSTGFERYPYLIQALRELGIVLPFRSDRLWAFFDSSYRARVDLDYFAKKWRRYGIRALHVAAWHYFEPNPKRDDYLRRLIDACHREAILVYAWLELPHVSEAFWRDHPEWREKTALLQDAHLDWRKLMNLANPACFREVSGGVHELVDRFDWDGVNLAELYFESLEGHQNAARFTPMNADIRREFSELHGFDPLDLFQEDSPRHHTRDSVALRLFLDYRAELSLRIERDWIQEMERARERKPHLDLVLTHVDDRLDTRMRDLIGADAASLLPLLNEHDFTFLIEDPASLWNRGPGRYTEIAARYQPITPRPGKLAIDINAVERYQDVYPTKQQTGIEFYGQLHATGDAFPKVALYAEHSVLRADMPLLASAVAAVTHVETSGDSIIVESEYGTGVAWKGGALVNGQPWPVQNEDTLWLPPGTHVVEASQKQPALLLLDFNADLQEAFASENAVEFTYKSDSRAFARLRQAPLEVEIDGEPATPTILPAEDAQVMVLPRGQHLVLVRHTPPPLISPQTIRR